MRIVKVISGGQTGADMGGLRAARALDIPTGGTATKGFMTEQGPKPLLLKCFGLVEHPSPDYPPRTKRNILDADATLIFSSGGDERGTLLTQHLCLRLKRPGMVVSPNEDDEGIEEILSWLKDRGVGLMTLNVAGHRESKSPGIERKVTLILMEVFQLINS